MLLFLKFLSFSGLLFRDFKFFFQIFYLILKLLNILFYLIILNNLKLFLLLIFDIFNKFKLFLQLIDSLVLHFNLILQRFDSKININNTYPKSRQIFPLLFDFEVLICTSRFVYKHLKVIFLCFIIVSVCVMMIVKVKKIYYDFFLVAYLFFLSVHRFAF